MLRFRRADGSDYSEWGKCRLGSLLSFKNGLNIGKEKFGSGIKFISVLDILNNNYIDYNNIRGMVDIDQTLLNEFDVEYGDILFQRSSETREDAGKSNVYLDKEKKATFGGFVIRGKKIGDYIPEFMNFCLRSAGIRKQIMRKAQGEQHVNVGQDILSNIEINLPCIEEQQKIAEFLSEVDNIIAASEQEIESLEMQKKGAMQKIFSQEVRFKADDGSEYPEWDKKPLESIFEYKNGGAFEKYVSANGKYELISLNSIDINGNLKISEKRVNYADWYLEKDDLVMVLSDVAHGDFLGLTDIIPENNKYVLNQRMGLLRKISLDNIQYLRYFINMNQYYFKAHGQGSSQKNLSKDDILKFELLLPCLEEQQKIADFLSEFDNAIEYAKEELEVWKNIKKGLLQQMFE